MPLLQSNSFPTISAAAMTLLTMGAIVSCRHAPPTPHPGSHENHASPAVVSRPRPARPVTHSTPSNRPSSSSALPGEAGSLDASAPLVDTYPPNRTQSVEPKIPADMLPVPGGVMLMGLDDRGEQDERPAHWVWIRPFLLDKTEVTNEAYARCVHAGVCRKHSESSADANHFGPDRRFRSAQQPISAVSHDDAQRYCAWVGKRLPTEAEWERAARGSDGRLYPWGNQKPDHQHAVFGRTVTAEVGSKPLGAGPYGHLDLAGNVWEWVADHYDPLAYRRPTAQMGIPADCPEILRTQDELRRQGRQGFTGTNPIPTTCEYVLRGGAFNYGPWGLRGSNRVHHPGRFRLVMSGFRCAKDWEHGTLEPWKGRGTPPTTPPRAMFHEREASDATRHAP